MTSAPRQDPAAVEAEVREKIHLEILKRTGAYHANDHVLLPSGHHTSEYIEKTLVTTEPSFTEGLGAVIAKHFAPWPIDVVLSTGHGALILSHCVARAHPSRPIAVYGLKRIVGGKRRVTLPASSARGPRFSWSRIWCRRGRPSSCSFTWSSGMGDRWSAWDACGGGPPWWSRTRRCSAW